MASEKRSLCAAQAQNVITKTTRFFQFSVTNWVTQGGQMLRCLPLVALQRGQDDLWCTVSTLAPNGLRMRNSREQLELKSKCCDTQVSRVCIDLLCSLYFEDIGKKINEDFIWRYFSSLLWFFHSTLVRGGTAATWYLAEYICSCSSMQWGTNEKCFDEYI